MGASRKRLEAPMHLNPPYPLGPSPRVFRTGLPRFSAHSLALSVAMAMARPSSLPSSRRALAISMALLRT